MRPVTVTSGIKINVKVARVYTEVRILSFCSRLANNNANHDS